MSNRVQPFLDVVLVHANKLLIVAFPPSCTNQITPQQTKLGRKPNWIIKLLRSSDRVKQRSYNKNKPSHCIVEQLYVVTVVTVYYNTNRKQQYLLEPSSVHDLREGVMSVSNMNGRKYCELIGENSRWEINWECFFAQTFTYLITNRCQYQNGSFVV